MTKPGSAPMQIARAGNGRYGFRKRKGIMRHGSTKMESIRIPMANPVIKPDARAGKNAARPVFVSNEQLKK